MCARAVSQFASGSRRTEVSEAAAAAGRQRGSSGRRLGHSDSANVDSQKPTGEPRLPENQRAGSLQLENLPFSVASCRDLRGLNHFEAR